MLNARRNKTEIEKTTRAIATGIEKEVMNKYHYKFVRKQFSGQSGINYMVYYGLYRIDPNDVKEDYVSLYYFTDWLLVHMEARGSIPETRVEIPYGDPSMADQIIEVLQQAPKYKKYYA
jgi:hypothetical protein